MRSGGAGFLTRYVGHACLDIEVGGVRIATDPWWAGPAYAGQWHAWPTPEPGDLERVPADYLYLSHGHADHLHAPTLARLAPGATALVPEFVLGSDMSDFVRSLGFERIVPLQHGRRVELRGGVTATCYVNVTDSLLVLEHRGRAIVEGNDALHASPDAVIDHFCELIARNHPRVETLFLGYGGASWFPNCVRLPGKDDVAEARAREALFSRNFVRVAQALRPRLACAFAAAFVLLEPHNRWINDVKLDLPGPDALLQEEVGAEVSGHVLLPGDWVDEGVVVHGRWSRPTRADLARAYRGELRAALERASAPRAIAAGELHELGERVRERLRERTLLPFFAPPRVELRLRDAEPGSAIQVKCADGRGSAWVGEAGAAPVALEMRSEILRSILDEPYGSEAVTIGYGAVAHLEHRSQLRPVMTLLRGLEPREHALRSLVAEARRNFARTCTAIARQRWSLAQTVASRLAKV